MRKNDFIYNIAMIAKAHNVDASLFSLDCFLQDHSNLLDVIHLYLTERGLDPNIEEFYLTKTYETFLNDIIYELEELV